MRKKIFWVIMVGLLGMSTNALAQEQLSLRDRATEFFRRYEYSYSANIFERLANASSNPRLYDLMMAGESYMKMGEYAKALNFFERASVHPDHRADNILRFAEALKINGHFDRAKAKFLEYAEITGQPDAVKNQIAGCDSALFWLSNPNDVVVKNQENINTAYSEFGVTIWDGQYYFVGEPKSVTDENLRHSWTGRPFVRIFNAQPGEKTLESSSIAGYSWNKNPFHLGPLASPDNGNTIYVTHNYDGQYFEKRTVENGRVYLTHRLEIQIFERQGNQWKKTGFQYNNPLNYSVAHPTFSNDGNVMYFTSDMPGGYGGLDIWYCERLANGTWAEPKNAGPAINSAGNELFPKVGADGQLYFSSDSWIGMGGLDIYKAEGELGKWTQSTNLGAPINSSWDDFAYVLVENNDQGFFGFLASNRPGGKGSDDIYSVTYEKPYIEPEPITVVVKGTVAHQTTLEPIESSAVEVYVGSQKIMDLSSGKNGEFQFSAEPGREYTIRASKTSFISDISEVSTLAIETSETLETKLLLEPEYKVGKTFVLENLYYDYDKANIRPDAAVILDDLVQILKENPTMVIELSSHTDSRGNDAYNLNLSQRRANSAVEYLISKGIAKERVVAKGYGETQLVNDCGNGVKCTEEQHQANRRTEVKVLAM